LSAVDPPGADWRPTASWENLKRRAEILAQIREFFEKRGVLEVETPLAAAAPASDLHLHSIRLELDAGPERRELYLQTSPEFAMKRLLAAGSGPIYQISKAFRDGESGRRHNPEFTLLEWYRPGFDHHALMDEVDELLAEILDVPPAERRTYGELFAERWGLDPHEAEAEELENAAISAGLNLRDLDRDGWLHLLWSHGVEPDLGRGEPTFVLDFPASQAALARIRPSDPPVAERFEVYVEGVELANGFHELIDAAEQRRRFEADLEARRRNGLPEVPIDEHLLAALEAGMPECAGIALGVDRLVMLAVGASSIAEVLAFPVERA